MENLRYIKPERISLKDNPEFNEYWLQDRIAEDPRLLGLGDLILKDKERAQTRAGRLDLLLQAAETNQRYEVEVQLGKTDEAHIIRTIEYWDIERKRYPQYDHTAVIVAEDITSRFLNVISLFNGSIPLIAIQLNAIRIGESISLVFTTVLDEIQLGLIDDDEETADKADRSYWETRSPETLRMVDELFTVIHKLDRGLELNFTKNYISVAKGGKRNNFVLFRPKKSWLRLEIRLERSDQWQAQLEAAGLTLLEYDRRYSRYRLRLEMGEILERKEILSELLEQSFAATK